MSTPVKLALIAVIIVVLFIVAVLLGARGDDKADLGGLIDRFGGRDPAGRLTAADLKGTCAIDAGDNLVTVTGACQLQIPAGGGFSLDQQARSLVLVAAAGSTTVATKIQGLDLSKRLDPGDDIDLRFNGDAGAVVLACRPPLLTCAVGVGSS